MAGAPWCVLTDGDEYRFYNATVAEDAERKLLWKARISEGRVIAAALSLISRKNLEEKRIDAVWNAYHVDRRVGEALRAMLDGAEGDLVAVGSAAGAGPSGQVCDRVHPPAACGSTHRPRSRPFR